MKKINKTALRQAAIKELVVDNAIADQQTLVELMKDRYNIETNQSILSRDLRAMGIAKRKVNDAMVYDMPARDASQEILRLAVMDILHNEAMIIIKTMPGLASFVADYLDLKEDMDIAGTLAGENCIFVAPASTKNIAQLVQKLRRLLSIKKIKTA